MGYRKVMTVIAVMVVTVFSLLGNVLAEDQDNTIRVGLQGLSTRVDFRVETGRYTLIDGATDLPIARPKAGQLWTVTKKGPNLKLLLNGDEQQTPYDGPIILQAAGEGLNLFSFDNTRYRGDLIIENRAGGILPVNKLSLEHYLYGVAGQEIGSNAPMEALKAQAVVSRSYAMALKQTRGSYDVGVDTRTQVYRGYDAEQQPGGERVAKAVDATRGQVILYDGKIIRAFFHANAGGYTENSENVWLEPLPYIKAVPSPYDVYAAEYAPQVNDWPGVTYSWEKNLNREELYSLISQWNKTAEEDEKFDPINVGSILDMQLSRFRRDGEKETESGRVTELTLIGDQGQASIYRDRIRILLGLRSTLFQMKFDSTVSILSGSGEQKQVNSLAGLHAVGFSDKPAAVNGREDNVYLTGKNDRRQVPKKFTQVYITGKGYGHGLGMSQWGARGMAEDGYNYEQIIQHYYNQDKDNGKLTIEKIY